ncbi:Coronin-like protein crn1 [Stygiomarasmius scandens]|uniref:Coronin n=1 Tax=Marasmiellus scandens TaxID=2682957 RepID=A0ABR1JBP6_9AGAR
MFAIIPLPSPFAPFPNFPHTLPDTLALARSHTAPVLDTDWSPHNDSIVASAGEDGKVMIWNIDASAFDEWGADDWEPRDLDPVWRIDASPRKVGQLLSHPTPQNVLASAGGDLSVKLWDLAQTETPKSVLTGHGDAIQSLAYNPTGTLLATTCRDRKLRLFDPRAGGEAVRITDGHGGIKASRLAWMGELDKIATTGFSKMSDRQVSIWEVGSLKNEKTIAVDQSAGVVMPFWTDNNILFLAGKGDGNIRYYEYESDNLYALAEYKSSDPQRGMRFLPRRALNVSECEIARAYKVSGSTVEPIAFIVPRKADGFQSDIFPPAPSIEPSMNAAEFFSGKTAPRKLADLASGTTFSGAASTTSSAPAPVPAAVPAPTATTTLPAPTGAAAVPAPSPIAKSFSSPQPSSTNTSAPPPSSAPVSTSNGSSEEVETLRTENASLKSQLREAREMIRNLELQVEAQRVNARKAAQALIDAAS